MDLAKSKTFDLSGVIEAMVRVENYCELNWGSLFESSPVLLQYS
jgi:hypothetical protein